MPDTGKNCPWDAIALLDRRRRHRVASGGRSVAPRWPRVVARLHSSAGKSRCPSGPGRSIALGVGPVGVSTGRWVVSRETGRRGSGGPCVPGHPVVVSRRGRRGRYDGGG